MSPDETPGQVQASATQPTLPARSPSPAAEKNARRRRLLDAQTFAQDISFGNPKVRYRYREGMQMGTLPVPIERAVLDIAYGRPQSLDKRLLDAIGAEAGRGLINLLLRKPLHIDPLTEARPVGSGSTVIEQEELQMPALEARPSIVPPSRPRKKVQGTAPPLRPGEEIMR